ncbi:MAG: hypothetical protein CL992_04160 [Euryarchaeota archaeon]|nr:hypothetical protein [Euryarchaeota archaeon]
MERFILILLTLGVTAAVTILPGKAVVRIIDPTADRWRSWMLAPGIGVLLLCGIGGWSVIILGKYHFEVMALEIAALNLIATGLLWERDVRQVRRLSPWERLELNMSEEEAEQTFIDIDDPEVIRERNLTRDERDFVIPLIVFAGLVLMIPLLLFNMPLGGDWIGFSAVADRLIEVGEPRLPQPHDGAWTYPPGFLVATAFVSELLRQETWIVGWILAHGAMWALIAGLVGAADRWGTARSTLIGIGLPLGIFAKLWDTGWPTVTSLLGIIPAIVILLRPSAARKRWHDPIFIITLLSVSVIHPSGAIYVGLLIIAHSIHTWTIPHHQEAQIRLRLVILSTVALVFGLVLALGLFAPRLFSEAVISEYGWQGGRVMMTFVGPIAIATIMILWKEAWDTHVGRITMLWFGLIWAISLVHLLVGWRGQSFLNLIDRSLYSMGMHGFQIPAALLIGMILGKPRGFGLIQKKEELADQIVKEKKDFRFDPDDPYNLEIEPETYEQAEYLVAERWFEQEEVTWKVKWKPRIRTVAIMFLFLQCGVAASAIILMQGHEARMAAIDAADVEALEYAASQAADGEVILIEGEIWNHLPTKSTAMWSHYPGLGLVELNDSPSSNITSALLQGDVEGLMQYDIAWAVTSIRGWAMSYIAINPQWELVADFKGTRVWKLLDEKPPRPHSMIRPITDLYCEPSCEVRKHPWSEDMSDVSPPNGGHEVNYTESGSVSFPIAISDEFQRRDVILSLFLLTSGGIDLTFTCEQGNTSITEVHRMGQSQWTRISITFPDVQTGQVNASLNIDPNGGYSRWINPLGSSGRSEVILDTQGLYVLFTEARLSQ